MAHGMTPVTVDTATERLPFHSYLRYGDVVDGLERTVTLKFQPTLKGPDSDLADGDLLLREVVDVLTRSGSTACIEFANQMSFMLDDLKRVFSPPETK